MGLTGLRGRSVFIFVRPDASFLATIPAAVAFVVSKRE